MGIGYHEAAWAEGNEINRPYSSDGRGKSGAPKNIHPVNLSKSNCRLRAFWAYLRMIVAAIYISMYGVACTNDGSQERKRPDVIFCDQISACIPFLKEVPILSWLLPFSPKVIYFNIFKLRILLAISSTETKSTR